MTNPTKDRHGWLRDALSDKGYLQKDLATAWGVDGATPTTFIRSGKPELTFDRALVLAKMLEMPLDELQLRLQEGVPPGRRTAAPVIPAPRPPKAVKAAAEGEEPGDKETALVALNKAVQHAIQALGVSHIEVVLKYGEAKEAKQ
jgi:hypothetical protein